MSESFHTLLRSRLQEFREDGIPPYHERILDGNFYEDMVTTLVGVRKAGKTYATYQVIDQELQSGRLSSLDQVCYLHFDDESLMTFAVHHLSQIDEALLQIAPDIHAEPVLYVFDEIHKIEGWEGYVLRLLRKRNSRILVTGSSADLEPEKVDRQLRGKSIAEHIYPLSFTEFCRWRGADTHSAKWSPKGRAIAEQLFDQYLRWGAFPGLHNTTTDRERELLLKTYCSTIVASDFLEKSKGVHPVLLKHYIFRLLQNNTGPYTHKRMLDALAGMQVPTDKRQLYALAHLAEENYLFDFLPIYAPSQAKMNQNPRKVYCADWALANAVAFPTQFQPQRALEAVVYWELRRRGYQVRYLRHPKTDYEVDFIAYRTFEEPELAIQVTCQMDDEITMQREIRSLANLTEPAFAQTRRLILTQRPKAAEGVEVLNVMEWLLDT
jgi:predicted AAA+ superfamily ATPase